MKKPLFLFLAAALTASAATAQRQAPVQDLNRATVAFRTADANHNGVLSVAEAQRQGFDRTRFKGFDVNADGHIDKAEFMVAFRRTVLDKGGRVADDLDSEVTRIMAKRKAEAEKRAAEERAKQERLKRARQEDARKKDADKPAERPPIRKVERVRERPQPAQRPPVQRTRTPR